MRKARSAAFPAPCWWREARAEATPRQTPAPPSDRICVVSQAAALTLPSDGPAEPDHPPPQPRLVPLPRFLPRARAPRDFHAAYAFTLVCLACGHTYVCEFPWCCMRWPWSTHTHIRGSTGTRSRRATCVLIWCLRHHSQRQRRLTKPSVPGSSLRLCVDRGHPPRPPEEREGREAQTPRRPGRSPRVGVAFRTEQEPPFRPAPASRRPVLRLQDCCVSYGGMWYLKGTVQS